MPFSWTALPAATGYYLTVGTTVGGFDVTNSGTLPASQTSYDAGALPGGVTLHARIYTELNGDFRRYSESPS